MWQHNRPDDVQGEIPKLAHQTCLAFPLIASNHYRPESAPSTSATPSFQCKRAALADVFWTRYNSVCV